MSFSRRPFNPFQTIALSFAMVILTGGLILMLPVSSVQGTVTPFLDALFTSTTSVCVTGLVIEDTASHWSLFGQFIILLLIQTGGLGVITVAAYFAMISGRRIGLMQRSIMQEAVAAPKMGGIVRLTGFIVRSTFLIELLGTAAMAPVFGRDFGTWKGLWMSLFHSVSAFCNAGLDLMGIREPFSSLTSYAADPVISITIMALIVTGGIGFLTWDDIRTHGIHLKKYRMQSKVILTTTLLLMLLPAVFFFFHEFQDMPLPQRLLSSFFQSITPRTAGFNTVDLTRMSQPGQALTIGLMLIGGSPGSTAGGMKTTTFAVLIACAFSVFRRRDSAQLWGRRIAHEAVASASAVALMYIGLAVGGAFIISVHEQLSMHTCLYETASALATVGLTLGITPELGTLSRCVLISLMYLGRIGGLTFIYAALPGNTIQCGKLPQEKITIG